MTVLQEIQIAPDHLEAFTRDAFVACGVRADIAADTARGLCFASLRGTDSHGIRLLPHFLDAVRGGRINPDPDFTFDRQSSSAGSLDADHTYGQAAGVIAMNKAIELAEENGVGMVAVKNSCYCGAMAFMGVMPCEHDMIGFAMTHASPKVLSPSSVRSWTPLKTSPNRL